jgi:hypothetical protein
MVNSTPSAITESSARDAFAIAFEHVGGVDLATLQAQRRTHTTILKGDKLKEACAQALYRAEKELKGKYPDADADELTAALNAVIETSGESAFAILDPCKPGKPQLAEFIVEGQFYKGKFHTIFGRDVTNKSVLMIWTLATLASQGEHVLLIEYEMDENAIGLMLDEMGFDREKIQPHFHVVHPLQPFCRELLGDILAKFPGCVAVALDNAAEAIGSAGGGSNGDENAAKDALTALAPLRDLAHQEDGPAVIVADHLPHARDNAARGSTAKKALDDVSYQVETPHPVTRTQAGDIKLTCRKDRPSRIGKNTEIWFTVGDGAGNLPIQRIQTPGKITDDLSEDGVKMIVALEKYAEKNPGNPWLTERSAIKEAGLVRTKKREDELTKLAADHTQPIQHRSEARGKAAAWSYYRYEKVTDDAPELAF